MALVMELAGRLTAPEIYRLVEVRLVPVAKAKANCWVEVRAVKIPVDGELLPMGAPSMEPPVMVRVPATSGPWILDALDLGADIVNDVWALRWRDGVGGPTGESVVAAHDRCGVCLMHMHRDPQTMQVAPIEGDVVPQVLSFLELLAQRLQGIGVDSTRICLDPGIGFGKTV